MANVDEVPSETESVREIDLKKAMHTLMLYLGELGEKKLDATVDIPCQDGGVYRADFSAQVGDIQYISWESGGE